MIDHPDWCDPDLCTVTAAAGTGGAHRGSPATLLAKNGLPSPLTVTASLYATADFPLAGPYVVLEVHGLDRDLQSVAGTTRVPVEYAASLGSVLLDLATAAGAAAGPSTSGPPRAVLREFQDLIDVVGRGGRVPLTFAEARDIENQLFAILAIFDPHPDNRASQVMNDVLARAYPAHQPGRAGGDQR